jgi:hypothetical protein
MKHCGHPYTAAAGAAVLAAGLLSAGCSSRTRPDTWAIACKVAVAPTTACVHVQGQAAVRQKLLDGTAYVLVLPGRSRPGSPERQCTRLGVRLVPYKGDLRILPLVADATENTFHVTCGIP